MEISSRAWVDYVNKLSKLDEVASKKIGAFLTNFKGFSYNNPAHMKALIDYAYGISTIYGEGAAALACEMYDAVGLASGIFLEPAIPAEVASYGDVAKAINGTAKYKNDEMVSSSIGRLVKRTGADTTLNNALRDGAEFAWIPSGDSCAFCIALASRGWQRASRDAIKGGHAEHIHSNCNCEYAIRFNERTNYKSYDPEVYKEMYDDAPVEEGQKMTPKNRINAMRREAYAKNKEEINAQKRDAYAKRQELNSSEAEEINVN